MKLGSKRLVYKKILPEHRAGLIEMNVSEAVRAFLGGAKTQETAAIQADELIETQPELYWAVILKDNNTFIGEVCITDHHDNVYKEISYIFREQFWGKGYAYEAVSTIIEYMKQNTEINELVAETQTKNIRSVQLLKKLGFKKIDEFKRFNEQQSFFYSGI